jgi:hypothetical protein
VIRVREEEGNNCHSFGSQDMYLYKHIPEFDIPTVKPSLIMNELPGEMGVPAEPGVKSCCSLPAAIVGVDGSALSPLCFNENSKLEDFMSCSLVPLENQELKQAKSFAILKN